MPWLPSIPEAWLRQQQQTGRAESTLAVPGTGGNSCKEPASQSQKMGESLKASVAAAESAATGTGCELWPSPCVLSPCLLYFPGAGRRAGWSWQNREEGAAFLQPPLCMRCSFSTVGRTSRTVLRVTPHGHQHELHPQWLGLHHPGTARIWGMLQHLQGSSHNIFNSLLLGFSAPAGLTLAGLMLQLWERRSRVSESWV